jgi:sec-independent protein translocase protein TatA
MEGILAPWHWIIIIAVVLLVFGPKKLPELGNSLGKGITGFRRGLKDVQDEVKSTMAEAETTEAPAEAAVSTAAPVREPVLIQSQTTVDSGPESKPQA